MLNRYEDGIEKMYDAYALRELISIGMGPRSTGIYPLTRGVHSPPLNTLKEEGLIRKLSPNGQETADKKYASYRLTKKGKVIYRSMVRTFQDRVF